ncbi:Methyltransferase domain-containing protein [Dehalogenimonas formicexedens]|uniref:Methyltransferase domain-containing protein n=1 Tax=Dehalogenimonas formicexedens TaxID=1839801 RepID=A0A1P8FAB1_9CHLR|nr:class I SAM-dependent methyltransferase [Dehalogenimonas formicexedens]APV45381.1 Methyltransferase domain-containing protein [Dehalogenimonas formicexedens]
MTDAHFDISKAARLDNPGRIAELRIPDLLRDIGGVKTGMVCVDLGCGTGTFTLPLAGMAGDSGKVFAVDDSAEMLGILGSRNPPGNVVTIKADFIGTGLENGIADFCLTAFILHETRHPEKLLAEAYRLLKPGGILLAVEWRPDYESHGPPLNIRISAERMETMFGVAGFKMFRTAMWTEKHYYGTGAK